MVTLRYADLSPEQRASVDLQLARHNAVHPASIPERVLQAQCEAGLEERGFERSTPERLERLLEEGGGGCRGIYVHLTDTQRNSILLDLLVLHRSGRFWMDELKRDEREKPTLRQRALLYLFGGQVFTDARAYLARMDKRIEEAER